MSHKLPLYIEHQRTLIRMPLLQMALEYHDTWPMLLAERQDLKIYPIENFCIRHEKDSILVYGQYLGQLVALPNEWQLTNEQNEMPLFIMGTRCFAVHVYDSTVESGYRYERLPIELLAGETPFDAVLRVPEIADELYQRSLGDPVALAKQLVNAGWMLFRGDSSLDAPVAVHQLTFLAPNGEYHRVTEWVEPIDAARALVIFGLYPCEFTRIVAENLLLLCEERIAAVTLEE